MLVSLIVGELLNLAAIKLLSLTVKEFCLTVIELFLHVVLYQQLVRSLTVSELLSLTVSQRVDCQGVVLEFECH